MKKPTRLNSPCSFKGDISKLDAKKWQEFSHAIVSDIQTRIFGAKSVSFEQDVFS